MKQHTKKHKYTKNQLSTRLLLTEIQQLQGRMWLTALQRYYPPHPASTFLHPFTQTIRKHTQLFMNYMYWKFRENYLLKNHLFILYQKTSKMYFLKRDSNSFARCYTKIVNKTERKNEMALKKQVKISLIYI